MATPGTTSVGIINAVGPITFLLLTFVIYVGLKGRFGTYVALATTANQTPSGSSPNASSEGKSTVQQGNIGTHEITQGNIGGQWLTPNKKPPEPAKTVNPPVQVTPGFPFANLRVPGVPGF